MLCLPYSPASLETEGNFLSTLHRSVYLAILLQDHKVNQERLKSSQSKEASMGWITRLILGFSSPQKRQARLQAIEAESKLWMVKCPHCSYERSVWEMGGIRYHASNTGIRKAYHYCPQCQKRGWHTTYKRLKH